MLRNILLLCIVGLLASTQGQEFGARIGKRIGRIGQSNGYFYPQPSPPFVIPVPGPQPTSPPVTTRPTTTRPVIITTPSVDYLPPVTQPVYIECNSAQDCILASDCSARRQTFNNQPNARCQSPINGQVGVCCNRPAPTTTTTPRPTTRPVVTTPRPTTPVPIRTTPRPAPTTTQPSYIQCSSSQDCVLANECSARKQTFNNQPNARCQSPFGGQVGVCCNRPAPTTTPRPAPTTTRPATTTRPLTFPTFPTFPTTPVPIRTTPRPAPTTTQPSYIQCSSSQDCVLANECSARKQTFNNQPNARCQSPFGGQVGVCCNRPAPTTTPRPAPTTTQPSYIQCSSSQDCVLANECSARKQTFNNQPNARCQSPFGGQVGVCCNRPAPTTTTTPRPTTRPVVTTPRPTTTRPTTTQPSYIQCSSSQDCVLANECSARKQTFNNQANARCQIPFGGQFGVCCSRPVPTTTLRPVVTTQRTTPRPTTLPIRTTPQTIRTTTPLNLEYLPPATTTAGYDYPVPENPLVPGSSNQEQQQVTRPTPRPTQGTVRPTQGTVRPTQGTVRPTQETVRPAQPSRPVVQPVLSESQEEILFWDFRESIAGEPEIDYPIFDKIPVTSFSCDGKINGYYADEEGRCQVFHICSQGADGSVLQNSFLCPNGTIFSQESFACLWWHDVECQSSARFFNLNANIGVVPESANSENVRTVSNQSTNQIKSSGSGIQISASAGAASSSFGGVGLTASASSGSSTFAGGAKQSSNAGYSKNSGY